MSNTDILIIGAGPAGTAAAITARHAGLHVTIIERLTFPRHRPGESLHPGIQPLLAQLGVEQVVLDANFLRFNGIWMNWAGPNKRQPRWFEPFGEDEREVWQGFQAWRTTFDQILLDHAISLGVQVHQPCRAHEVLLQEEQVIGINTDNGPIRANFVIDATGSRHWLATQLNIPVAPLTTPLFARYGYMDGHLDTLVQDPMLTIQRNGTMSGWLWVAPVTAPNHAKQTQWTELMLPASQFQSQSKQVPELLSPLTPAGRIHGADVTWRVMEAMAGPGYFAVGDAAFILDPTSSHGVLRAIMSGIYATNLIIQSTHGHVPADVLPAIYHDWMRTWLQTDIEKLKSFYGKLSLADIFLPVDPQ
ncbi:MAG: tryptophan 7-halogenase [Chloroflexota bacterium]